uniref:G-protein coupled receptors family 1 profile domain-containing protein n=1 Tax=Romanomermis culicivorax TaxID=13658 RepID=A0A915J1U4_ROMCU
MTMLTKYFAIIFPTEYQRHSLRAKSAPYIVMVWLISSAVSAPIFMEKIVLDKGICWIEDPQYMIMSALLTFFIPAFIITYLYSKIFKRIRKHLNLFWAGAKRRGFSATTLPQVIVEEVRSRRNSRIENNSSPSGSLSRTPSARKLSTEEPSMGPRSRLVELKFSAIEKL